MGKKSAIEEYCKGATISQSRKSDITNNDLHELLVRMRNEQYAHLREQDLLLEVIRNQSRPQFGREFLANLSANAVWDGFLFIGSKLLK